MGIINNHLTVKPGTVIASPASSMPGYLLCNGAALNRKTYARLFAAIGTAYNTGNGPNTFNLPDFRGIFLRGYSPDSTAIIGKRQADGLPNITGQLSFGKQVGGIISSAGAFTHQNTSQDWAGTSTGTANVINFIDFDASKGNGVYGRSAQVLPRHHVINYFIKY